MATGTNGIATISDLMTGKGLRAPAYGPHDPNRCPTAYEVSTMGGTTSGYQANQLVKYSDVTVNGVLFTVTIDNRSSSHIAANLNIAYRFQAAPGAYAFGNIRHVGYTSMKGITTHNTGPFGPTEQYGNSNVLLWTGPLGFNYSYSNIVGTSGIIYSSSGSGTYNGTNNDGYAGTNLEYITLFSQPINAGDSISLTIIIY